MKQVYNHPSIAVWEAANHTQSFKGRDVMESNLFCEKVYNTIYPVDPSRLISFNSYVRHLHYGNDAGTIDQQGNPIEPSPAWTAPMVTRGNQDGIVGYSRDWSLLRNWPDNYIKSFLDSKQRAYFNFEHEESMGQPNWNLSKGKPWHRLHSYEWEYDEGTIGRRLGAGRVAGEPGLAGLQRLGKYEKAALHRLRRLFVVLSAWRGQLGDLQKAADRLYGPC